MVQNIDGTWSSINGMVNPIVNGAGGAIPRWRHYLYLDWKLAPWNVTFAQQYQSHYKDMPGSVETLDPTSPDFTGPQLHQVVGEYQLFHLFASYTGFMKEQLRITLGIRNLFDQKPPYTNAGGQNYFQGGYDPGMPIARQDVRAERDLQVQVGTRVRKGKQLVARGLHSSPFALSCGPSALLNYFTG